MAPTRGSETAGDVIMTRLPEAKWREIAIYRDAPPLRMVGIVSYRIVHLTSLTMTSAAAARLWATVHRAPGTRRLTLHALR